MCQSAVFSEFVNFMGNNMTDLNYILQAFKMRFLTKLYKERLPQLIATDEQLCLPNVHVSRLRHRIIAQWSLTSLVELTLPFDKNVAAVMLKACLHDTDKHDLHYRMSWKR